MLEWEAADEPRRRQTLDDVLRPAEGRDIRRLPRLMAEAFRLVWRAARRELLVAGSLQLAAGISLAGQLFVARRVLQSFGLDGQDAMPELAAVVPELAAFAALLVVVAVAGIAQREQQRVLTERVTKYTTGHVLDVAVHVDLIDFDRPVFHDRLERARVNASVRPLQIVQGVVGILSAGAAVLAVGVTLILIEPAVAALILVGGLPAIYINRLSSRALHTYQVAQTPGDRRRAYLYQTLTRREEAQEIRAFDSEAFLRDEHDRLFDRRIEATRKVVRKRLLLGTASGLVAALVTVAAILLLFWFVSAGRLALSDAAIAIGAVVLVAGRLRSLIAGSGALYEGAIFLKDFTDFVSLSGPPSSDTQGREVPLFERIELRDVSFTYPSRQMPSLRDVNLEIDRGEVIALVGENGSGKTTLTKLLAGLYRPSDGAVLWDGRDTKGMELSALREHVTVIFQDFARYFLTAAENIGISRHERMTDRTAIEEAARAAGADGFLEGLERGFDSLLGPAFVGGSDLSLGQWQRVALARAYFRASPLLILDEPTASLDPRGEYEIFQQVRRLAAGRTVVLVSHRFSSVRVADRILVLSEGRIVESGAHEELMSLQGLYAELFQIQASGYASD